MIRVVVADDHHLVRQGISALLARSDDIEVVGEAEDGEEAVEVVRNLQPDVLVTDISMAGLNGIEVTVRICSMGLATQVVILSMYSDESLVRRALRGGARGYLLKRSVEEELLLAIRAAAQGEVYLSPAISAFVLEDIHQAPSYSLKKSGVDKLTSREREVLQLIAEGHTNASIATRMHISVKTVEKHRANLMDKLNVHDIAGLTRFAIKHKLVFPDG